MVSMNADILNQLKDIHMPKAPSWWPLALGYYIIIALIILITLIIIIYLKYKLPKIRLRKYIKLELINIEKNYNNNKNTSSLQNSLVALLKRVARAKAISNTHNIKLCVESLMPKGPDNEEFIELLERDRFKKISTISSSRLLSLAHKKFKRCKL
jgi:hypothetical protein